MSFDAFIKCVFGLLFFFKDINDQSYFKHPHSIYEGGKGSNLYLNR